MENNRLHARETIRIKQTNKSCIKLRGRINSCSQNKINITFMFEGHSCRQTYVVVNVVA